MGNCCAGNSSIKESEIYIEKEEKKSNEILIENNDTNEKLRIKESSGESFLKSDTLQNFNIHPKKEFNDNSKFLN